MTTSSHVLDPILGNLLDEALRFYKQGYRAIIAGFPINEPYIRNSSGILQFEHKDTKFVMWGALKSIEMSEERERANHRATGREILKAMGIHGVTADLDTDFPKLVKQGLDYLREREKREEAHKPATKRFDNLPPGVTPPGLVRKES